MTMDNQTEIAVPTVHLNGDNVDVLFNQQLVAIHALRAATEALQAAAPNGRNFYVQAPGALGAAALQHEARCNKLRAVFEELEHIAIEIDKQRKGR